MKTIRELDPPGFRTCSKCKEPKPFAEFHKRSNTKSGLKSECRDCRSQRKPPKPSRFPPVEVLWQDYQREKSVHKVAILYDTCGETIRQHLIRAGYRLPRHFDARDVTWTKQEVELLKRWYSARLVSSDFELNQLAKRLGRLRSNVSRKARSLGLTKMTRAKTLQPFFPNLDKRFANDQERNRATGERMKRFIQERGHPRGMLGRKHSPETVRKMSENSRRTWQNFSEDQRAAIKQKSIETAVRNGTLVANRPHGSWKAGWRDIGGVRRYYRSRWEANYARYLEWLKSIGEIANWEHEPTTFWFEVQRGCRTYLPDFRVVEKNGKEAYHEVKGWMDAKSQTKIKRMGIYHPDVNLIVIDGKQYRSLQSQVGRLIPGWESEK